MIYFPCFAVSSNLTRYMGAEGHFQYFMNIYSAFAYCTYRYLYPLIYSFKAFSNYITVDDQLLRFLKLNIS